MITLVHKEFEDCDCYFQNNSINIYLFFLHQLDEDVSSNTHQQAWERIFKELVASIQSKLGMELFGIDVIQENITGRFAVIDINAFPSKLFLIFIIARSNMHTTIENDHLHLN